MASFISKPTLLSLPGEVRNIIWEEALYSPTPIPVLSTVFSPGKDSTAKLKITPRPAASLVCKDLQDEVLSIYYSINTFTVPRITFRKVQGQPSYEEYLAALRQWQKQMATRHLRYLEINVVLDLEHARRTGYVYDHAFTWMGRVERSRKMVVRLTDELKDFCVCDFSRTHAEGRSLVDAAIEVLQNYWPTAKEQVCTECWRLKLARGGEGERVRCE